MHSSSPSQERVSATGAVIVSVNQLALLHGLLDRPNCCALSRTDFVRAAIPYAGIFRAEPSRSSLRKELDGLPEAWVSCLRAGRKRTWMLMPRGRAIAEHAVATHVAGHGPYTGLASLREESKQRRRVEFLRACIARADSGLESNPLPHAASALVVAWRCHHLPTSHRSAIAFGSNVLAVRTFVERYLHSHGVVPSGVHPVAGLQGCGSDVDFDRLYGKLPLGIPGIDVTNIGELLLFKPLGFDGGLQLTALRPQRSFFFGEAGVVCEPIPALRLLRVLSTIE